MAQKDSNDTYVSRPDKEDNIGLDEFNRAIDKRNDTLVPIVIIGAAIILAVSILIVVFTY